MKNAPLTILLLLFCLASVQAQDSTKKVFFWFDLEAGIGFQPEYEDPSATKFGWQLQINRHLFTIHAGAVGSDFSTHSEIGLLYGRIFNPLDSKFMGAISTGLSYVSDVQAQFGLFGGPSGSTSTFQGYGIPFQAQIQYRAFKYFSFGATAFTNINRDQNFGGITLGIQLGKFRE